MGDPRKLRRKYSRPEHLWRSERITEESELCKKYGLKNKREIWKVKFLLRKFRHQARKLLAMKGEEEAEKEKRELLTKLRNLGIEVKNLEDVLGLDVEHLLDRRLQTIVHKKGLANTIEQARQYITHSHVLVKGKVVTIPSYFVLKDEENEVTLKEHIKVIHGERKERKERKTTTTPSKEGGREKEKN
jgi:small subunit ribosomal protein S4